ncbi:uncharacterized protein LOC121420402 isoform X5 [Lytechinus variegatus]|uniref:uncharacterized protein LOC121420402 isoform X5 n=1 Tax=Lytechinus variegatus TaxID=7654 RepID=UPI001BB25F19|nr:uncharacterized protein LOC121420402 isoform X5 [Lytechinus variegatus]
MESSSASEGASPDVRPVICESLLDLTDWGDLLVEQSSQASSAEDNSCASPADEHFSFAFKDVIFREEKIQDDDDDDDLPEISFVPSPESTIPLKKEKRSTKSVKVSHNRKSDKKASVLTEQRGKNTPVAPHSNSEDKKEKRKEGRSSPLITLAVSSLKKPGAIKERKLVSNVVVSGCSASGTVGSKTPVVTVQTGSHSPAANKGAHSQQSNGSPNALQLLNTPQDGRVTPTHPNLVTILPPTPPNEPVVVQQTMSRVVPKGLPQKLPMPHVQVFVNPMSAKPSNPQGVSVSPFSSPTIQLVKQSQVLTPPIDRNVAPVKQEQPLKKTVPPLQKLVELPKKTEQPPQKLEKPAQKLKDPIEELVKVLPKPEEPQGCTPSKTSSETTSTKDLTRTIASTEDFSGGTKDSSVSSATVESVRVEEVDEEIEVVEIFKPSQDETDSQVEVTESKLELKEDTKEVLSSLKRKAPSSPCSTLLKIKCEKIDAVVRVNKTNEELYRAEGSQEKRSVQARRKSSSAAKQGCFFNVVDKSSRLGVCPCGRANSYDAMIACDNPKCEVEWYHFTCVGVTKVPKDEWFCPFCSKEAAEALRLKKERRKELRLRRKKREELKRQRMKKDQLEEPGLCPCGQPNSWDRMIACDGQDCSVEWYHFRCVDVKSAPDTEWLCILCRDSAQEPRSSPYARRKRKHRPIQYSIYGDGDDGSADDAKEEMEWKADESSDDSDDSSDGDKDSEDSDSDDNSHDGRDKVRERARSKWREALSKDGDIDDSESSDGEDELSQSRRSRRMRHKKIDLDFEDGAEFDEDVDSIKDEVVRTKITPKRRRMSSGEKRSQGSNSKTQEPPDKEKGLAKMVSSGSGDKGSSVAVETKKIESEGRFLIQECSSCGTEFITEPTDESDSSNQDDPSKILCHLCVNKSKNGGQKSPKGGILLTLSNTKDTATNPATGGREATTERQEATASSSSEGEGKKDGDAQGSRSTRFHEIVACKVCGMGYRTRVSLLIHMKAKHLGHLGNFECAPCDRLFISQEECEHHMASFHHV